MRALLVAFIGGIVGTIFTSMIVLAWAGPSSAPPNGNVSAPVNVGSTDQVKDGGFAVNAFAVFGNQILSGTSRYLNFGTLADSSGYGVRDNAGVMEFKNTGGSWQAPLSASSTFSQIKFADGTTQTTAASSAGAGWTICTNENSDNDGTADIAACTAAASNGGAGTSDYRVISCRQGSGNPVRTGVSMRWSGTSWQTRRCVVD